MHDGCTVLVRKRAKKIVSATIRLCYTVRRLNVNTWWYKVLYRTRALVDNVHEMSFCVEYYVANPESCDTYLCACQWQSASSAIFEKNDQNQNTGMSTFCRPPSFAFSRLHDVVFPGSLPKILYHLYCIYDNIIHNIMSTRDSMCVRRVGTAYVVYCTCALPPVELEAHRSGFNGSLIQKLVCRQPVHKCEPRLSAEQERDYNGEYALFIPFTDAIVLARLSPTWYNTRTQSHVLSTRLE